MKRITTLLILFILSISMVVGISVIDTKKPESISFSNGIKIDNITIVRKGNYECLDVKFSETIEGAYNNEIPEPVRLIFKNPKNCWIYNNVTYKEDIKLFTYLIEHSKDKYKLTNDKGKIYDFNKKTLVSKITLGKI